MILALFCGLSLCVSSIVCRHWLSVTHPCNMNYGLLCLGNGLFALFIEFCFLSTPLVLTLCNLCVVSGLYVGSCICMCIVPRANTLLLLLFSKTLKVSILVATCNVSLQSMSDDSKSALGFETF